MATPLHRCVSVIDNSETGRSLMARSNHRIYKKELQSDWIPEGQTIAVLAKGSFVAMKQYCGGEAKKKMKELCQKEFELLSKCNHNNVVTVLGQLLDVDDNNPESWPVIFMELGECSLQFALTAKRKSTNEFTYPTGEGGYTWHHCLSWLRQLASAMAYLHKEGVVHRDLKSSNVLLFEGKKQCKVCDFDMSRYYDLGGMTVDIGTWRWMAPEVRTCSWKDYNKKQLYDFKVDCYSFGILICECVYRQRPFDCYEDRLFQNLDMPDTLELDTAMMLTRSTSDGGWNVILDQQKSHFPLSEKLWKLIKDLLRWRPNDRPNSDMIVSRLAIEQPPLKVQASGQAIADGIDLPQLIDVEAEADSQEPTPTDTGLPGNVTCPAIPSMRRTITCKLCYLISGLSDASELTAAEKERILEMLRTHADDVVSFLEEDEETNNEESQQVTDNVTNAEANTSRVQSHFRFTDSGQLEHEISGADADTCERVANVCRQKENFLQWMADLFKREQRHKRLRCVRFCSVDDSASGVSSVNFA